MSTADNTADTAENTESTADNTESTADNPENTADNTENTADNTESTADNTESTADSPENTADTSNQIIFMIDNLPEREKRRTLLKIQPLMSSTLVDQPTPQMAVSENQASSSQGKYSLGAGEATLVVKSNTSTAAKLRQFSGTVPIPGGQVDFNTWYHAASRLCKNTELSDDDKLARIHNSLSSPALDIAQSALDSESHETTLQLLKNVYGSVEDPQDVLNDFHTTVMSPKELPSEYLTRLHLKLHKLKNLNILQHDAPTSLLKQFIYGCSDETLIMKLHLEEKKTPPEYGVLLLSLRTEEAKRRKKHFAFKTTHSYQQNAEATPVEDKELTQLKSEVSSLQAQIANMSAKQNDSGSSRTPRASTSGDHRKSREQPGSSRRKLKFCFKCGEPGHVVWRCTNPHNPELVCRKFEEAGQEN
jgi:hypothetical protein